MGDPQPAEPSYDASVRRILALAREHLGVEAAWASEFTRSEQVFRHVDAAAPGIGPEEGSTDDLAGSYCLRVLDGRLPPVVSAARQHPGSRDLPVTAELGIGSYVGVPIRAADGSVRGMLCCMSGSARPDLSEADLPVLRMLGDLLSDLAQRHHAAPRELPGEVAAKVAHAVAGTTRRQVLQPIVDVATGRAAGVEALARFAEEPHRPDVWFAEAERVGLRVPLELAAARDSLAALSVRPGFVSVNLSPEAVTDPGFSALFDGVDPGRVVVEITEHAAVADYAALEAALRPHRHGGLRLAVDDAGAGYASFRHILQLRPDLIKVDISLVRDIEVDPVRQALVASLLTFARTAGAELVAEGVETQAELDTLARLGVTLAQGYLLARPADAPPVDGFLRPSPHVVLGGGGDVAETLARAVVAGSDLESLARPLLDAVLALTGLETSYLTVLDDTGTLLEHRFVRNAGPLVLPEGLAVDWADSLCHRTQEKRLVWTGTALEEFADCEIAVAFGVQTYLSVPMETPDGRLLGTLCAGSRQPTYIGEAAVAQIRLFAHVIATRLQAVGLVAV